MFIKDDALPEACIAPLKTSDSFNFCANSKSLHLLWKKEGRINALAKVLKIIGTS